MMSNINLQCDDASVVFNYIDNNEIYRCEIEDHENKLLDLVCLKCNEKKICSLCAIDEHNGHNMKQIKKEFEKILLPFVNIHGTTNNLVLNKSEQYEILITNEYKYNKNKITSHYSKIIDIIKKEEKNAKKQLKNLYQEQKKIIEATEKIIMNEIENLRIVVNNNNNNNNDILIKNYDTLKQIVSKGNNNSKLLSNYNGVKVSLGGDYNCKDSSKNCSINPQPSLPTSLDDFIWFENIYYINKNNFRNEIPKDTISIAIGPDVDIEFINITSNIQHVLLLDTYNVPLKKGSIKANANYSLHILAMKLTLTRESIPPNTINTLYLHDGFSQNLESFIHESISELHLYDIKTELTTIPACVGTVHFHTGFSQIIKPGCLNENISNLHFHGIIENAILPGAIPSTVKQVNLHNGFSQELVPGIIPCGIKEIKISSLIRSLKPGSIPTSVDYLYLNDGFDQILEKGVLTNIKNLYVGNIQKLLIEGSVPNTVLLMHFSDGFDQVISEDIIPQSVKTLKFGNIEKSLMAGSIPNSVEKIYFLDGFSTQLTKDKLPNNIKDLEVGNIKYSLTNDSIPNSVETMVIKNYNHQLKPDHLPNRLTLLNLYALEKPLEKGSLPKGLKSLQIGAMNGLSLEKGILNDGLEYLKFFEMSNIRLTKDSIPNTVKNITAPKSFEIFLSPLFKNNKNIKIEYT